MADDARDEASSDVVTQGDSEPKAKAPQARSSDGHYHVFDSETCLRVKADAVQLKALPEVAELLNLEEMSLDDFLAALKAGEIVEMVLLRLEPNPEEVNSPSVMDEDILEDFRKQRASRLGSEILKNPKDPVYPLMKEFEDVVSKDPPYQLPPDRGIRHEIDLVPGTKSQKDLRKWLGLANYLHTYSAGYAGLAKPLSDLLKKDTDWRSERQRQEAFDNIKASLQRAPILPLPDELKPFSVVCDASYYAVDCALLQSDEDGHERVISFQFRQLKAAERNYPVHDKELLAMKYALAKFRVHLLGFRPFVVYTDHASLRTATNSPHLSQRMARWPSFFAEYNFRVEYKPGKLNVLVDALSRRPDYELAHISRVTTDLYDRIRLAYRDDESFASLARFFAAGEDAKVKWLSPRQRSRPHRFEWADGLLHYRVELGDPPRVVVPNDEDLKFDILQEAHDAPSGGHLGLEKTFLSVSQTFWCPHQYKWVAWYVKTRETCQRVKPFGHASAPWQSLTVPFDCWKSMSLDFVFGHPVDDHGNNGILVFVCRLSKMVHLAPVLDTGTGEQAARLFVDCVFRHHGLPETIVSDRDPRCTAAFWKTLFRLLETKLSMSTADHPETDGQTERVNRVLEDTVRSVCAEAPRTWSDMLPMVEFALNNAVHASTGFTPFYLNGLLSDVRPASLRKQLSTYVDNRLNVISRVRDAMAQAQDRQKEYSDRNGRGNLNVFNMGELVLLDTRNLPLDTVSSVGSNKLMHRFIGAFAVLRRHVNAYTIDLPKSMKTHPAFYVGRLKRYHDPQGQSAPDDPSQGQEEVIESLQNQRESQTPLGVPRKPVQARGKRVGSPAGRMTKVRAIGVPQQGLHKPGGPSVAHHTSESRTTVGSRAAGSHGARPVQIGGGKPPGEVSTLRQRPLGGQHGHGDHGSHDEGSGPQCGGPPEPPASRTGRQLDRQGHGPTQSRLRKGDHGRDASLPVAMQPLGRRSSTEIKNPQPLSETRSPCVRGRRRLTESENESVRSLSTDSYSLKP
ncbi:unnamed protein product [Phytophthora fragariaefolia]|uniref:Unnamed protein product n=1 Tax=Phytophthora fragariaefolia TaxID=1490495 RepID=A0A9W6Y0R9_9STRA|nr:unnamed protein product [Phytophthora fragariaefolia]